ncbi:hypothetical protein DE146DRAFT_612709 [Phaeosphaeria sp. MPI-PUGE-AT-0046c]|nr:hypothetical protein DE146DRAFT_612709 [Phaeosphaeria sp. MPI-PUGE-AT-0046c]
MYPKKVMLHDQYPEEVMLSLGRSPNPQAMHIYYMVQTAQVYPLNEEQLRSIRLHLKGTIGDDVSNYPILVGPEDLPFEQMPTRSQLQNVLKEDIGDPNFFRFAPSRGSPELDVEATFELLQNLLDPFYSNRGAVIHMTSPTLNGLRIDTPATHIPGTLGISDIQLTLAPNTEVFELEYFAYTRVIPLLLGTQVVVTFPPVPANLSALRNSYENESSMPSVFMHTSPSLSHGIALVQKAGETLVLPPFWSHVICCTQTCVSAAYSVASVAGVADRARHIDLLRAVMQIWPDKSKEQSELTKYARELASHMDRVLNGKIEGYAKTDKFALPLWKGWDGDFRDKFGGLCMGIEDQEERTKIREMVNMALVKFVDAARKKRPECRMCHVRIEMMKGDGTAEERLAQHVRAVHGV